MRQHEEKVKCGGGVIGGLWRAGWQKGMWCLWGCKVPVVKCGDLDTFVYTFWSSSKRERPLVAGGLGATGKFLFI